MTRFINTSSFRPESFLSYLPFWHWSVNGYSLTMVVWNMLLAGAAMYVSYRLAKALPLKNYYFTAVLGLLWLLLVPNSAYIISDVRHIIGYCPPEEYGRVCQQNAWMSLFFFAYGAVGWLSFVYSLRPVVAALRKKLKFCREYFLVPLIIVIALGVLMGLVNRWNSWEIISDPLGIIRSVARSMADLTYLKNWLIMSVLLYILYVAGERLFSKLKWE